MGLDVTMESSLAFVGTKKSLGEVNLATESASVARVVKTPAGTDHHDEPWLFAELVLGEGDDELIVGTHWGFCGRR
jgi:hypothetical protein